MSNSYSGKNVNSLIEEGMPLEESLKSILELPLINNNIVKKNVSEIEDYQGSRSNLIKNNNNNILVYIAMISQLRDREGFPELSDSDFNLQLNGIKDFIHKNKNFYQKEIKSIEKEIKNQQKKLGFDFKENTKLSDNYILSLEYLHNNFSLELLYNHLESDIDVLSKWYDLKKESIDNKFVKIIIKEVFNIFYKENNYFSNNSQEDLLKGSEDFIFKLVLNCPEDFKDIKNQLLRGPHGKIYEKIFVSSDREIVKELIENKNHQKLKELYNLSTYTDIKNNFGKFLSSNNIQLIDVLFQELPSNKFAEFFNTCTYQEQRYLLNQESFLSKAMEPINNGEKIKFNCESFENFKEVFEKLRLKNHLYFLTSESNNDLDFINYKIKWECCSLLKFISVPKIDSVIEYLIDEMPLSFSTSYELSLRDNYSGFLPRNLNSQEFIKLVKKVNEECKGIMYIPQSQNSSGSIHNCLVNENIVGKSKSLKMQNINASLDLYLTILEDLQFSPKDYALIFVSLQKLIANNLTSLIVSEPLVKNDYLSKRVYSWAEIPKDCLVLNEIKLIFDSKYHMLDNLNTFNSNINSSEEYIHNFFNVFIDKKIYLEGLRLIREDNLLNDGVCNNRFRSFNINCISPYKYNAKDSDYESLYITNYSVEELEKFTDDIAKVNPSLWFDSNLPKLAILKTQELRKLVAENKDKFFGSLNDNDYKTAKDNSLLTFIDENINSKNIWSALLACSETYEDSIKNAEREFIFNEILSKPNLDVKTLKKISFLIDLQTELSSDNDLMYQNKSLLYKLEKGILYCFTSPELKIKKIVVENLIMDLQIKIPDSKGKVMKL